MKIQTNVSVHNKFEIEVRDSLTGELKQELRAYNVVLNSYYSNFFASRMTYFSEIAFGSGTGTPSVSDTSLFHSLGRKSFEKIETVYAYPTSYFRTRCILTTTDFVGTTITELGFEYRQSSYTSSWTGLLTHAMLEDLQGNPAYITKTDHDVVTVYATVYFTVTYPENKAYVIPASAQNNAIIKLLMGGGFSPGNFIFGGAVQKTASEQLLNDSRVAVSATVTASGGGPVRINIKAPRLDYNQYNDNVFGSFGCPYVAAWNLPDASIFPTQTVLGVSVGTGDGTTTVFSIPTPYFIANTDSVYVNGVQMTRGTDYTVTSSAITFMTAPASGSIITMDFSIDKPIKTKDFVVDAEFTVVFARASN